MPPELDTDVANLLPNHQEEEKSTSTSAYAAPRACGPNADSAVYRLPFELLDQILNFLVHESPNLLPFDKRSSLSTESFASAPPHVPEDIIYLHKFVGHYPYTVSLTYAFNADLGFSSGEVVRGFSMRVEVDCLPVKTFDSRRRVLTEYAGLHSTKTNQ